jgi:hypothetical protein
MPDSSHFTGAIPTAVVPRSDSTGLILQHRFTGPVLLPTLKTSDFSPTLNSYGTDRTTC